MRLKHIHLAGFKSFVDPVTIPAPAQLTGIVGPNGCGKSNVIDAVRWVLGESKARELRGESLQDVIFNGSADRKPASRASVELLFDNSAGKAPGQWSQYAEISVKRVLTRNGDSSYYINNVHVRRRDIADLMLGTGLGGDAYAIIEQGMISRLIEAKPEEMRGYLEEAAGVSKYKERRKETERRLIDTRENLERVDDIRRELGAQLEKLSGQAEVAKRYFALTEEKTLKEQLLALMRQRQAQARQAALNQDIERSRTEIEAKIADLRRLESELEAARLGQFSATEAVNQAQAGFYAESGEVARLEQALQMLRERRERLEADLRRLSESQSQTEAEKQRAEEESRLKARELDEAREMALSLEEQARELSVELPAAEATLRQAQAQVAEVQRELANLEQTVQLEQSHVNHAERVIDQLKQRHARLAREQIGLAAPAPEAIARQEVEMETAREQVETFRAQLEAAKGALAGLDQARREAALALEQTGRGLHKAEAELAALKKLQDQAAQAESEGRNWLERQGLARSRRLWQAVKVTAGWENALEAALGERLAALVAEARSDWFAAPPESRFDFILADAGPAPASPAAISGLTPLRQHVATDDALAGRLLDDWLALAYVADDLNTALAARGQLPVGGLIATPQGHVVTRSTLTFNAPEKGHHGLLARAREIEALQIEVDRQQLAYVQAETRSQQAEQALHEARRQADQLQAELNRAQAHLHQVQMGLVRDSEAAKRAQERREQLEQESQEIAEQLAEEELQRAEAQARLNEARTQREFVRERLEESDQARAQAEQALMQLRDRLRQEEREVQEAGFRVRAIEARLQELAERRGQAERRLEELAQGLENAREELMGMDPAAAQAELEAALERRQAAEQTLIAARNALEGENQRLREMEQQRLNTERALEPLKANIQALELKLQEARLREAQFAEQLAEVDVEELAAKLPEGARDSDYAADIERLGRQIAELGAVNMAAVQELEEAQARKSYLDAQAEDLTTAANTLEEAIRRIDAETRSRLKATYDTVSREFRNLFTDLFGGGEAQLILTGEEILDAGLIVVAQPPGKKNSSIHLLSGGEKALTALSLVFAFFRLNPAPFCLLDEVDAPLDDSNTERYCNLVRKMSGETQFMFITHNRITMEMAQHLVGVTMPEPGVSRPVAVDVEDAVRLAEAA
ncbi:condensin subunit Smc [Sulfuritortus calidifontis]|uniref:Chromosome partition protein Smc n=1 Tax=Sulfuritortus calidifontis TaxID=1914471 RepID=A0A4R3JV62_9PROT|nr:chromosome segregation protein SMC [Sulfuritortus calidifontis]TCS70556.1 condensin subunit Smc [Sulfuritortus calidifontis]